MTAAVVLWAASCSSGTDTTAPATTTTQSPAQQVCQSWANVTTAFAAYDKVDVLNSGLDSLRSYLDGLQTALQQLEKDASAALDPKVAALRSALQDLQSALQGGAGAGSVPGQRADAIRGAARNVDAAWNALVDAFKVDCPSVTATTIAS